MFALLSVLKNGLFNLVILFSTWTHAHIRHKATAVFNLDSIGKVGACRLHVLLYKVKT